MMRTMTFHLHGLGHPIYWAPVAVYGSSYGIALNAARSWREDRRTPHDLDGILDSHCVVEVVPAKDDKPAAVARSQLWFDSEHYRTRQTPDDRAHIVQWHLLPVEIGDDIKTLVTEHLRSTLITEGFFIPRAEWQARYPDDYAAHIAATAFFNGQRHSRSIRGIV